MVRSDIFITQAFTQVTRNALSHAASVYEHQSCLVLPNQLGDTVVNFFPDLVRHDRFEGRVRNLDFEVEPAHVTSVDDRALRSSVGLDISRADEEARDFFDRFLRRGQADSNQWLWVRSDWSASVLACRPGTQMSFADCKRGRLRSSLRARSDQCLKSLNR